MEKTPFDLILKYGLVVMIVILLAAGCGQTTLTRTPAKPSPSSAPSTPAPARADIILATTTSTQDSGLLDILIPLFEQKTGYRVKTTAVGTGAALALGEKGDADVLLVHAPDSEKKLVDNNTVINYQLVMHNDFILVGPSSDPASIKGQSIRDALKAIALSQAVFISRGDDSGTDKMEKSLWQKASTENKGNWYQESGSGMGQTLSIASEKLGYTLTDRATYLANLKNLKLDILVEGDSSLLNIYHVMQVNQEKFPQVNGDGAKSFVKFMVSADTQKTIGEFGKEKYGQSLFIPDAGRKIEELAK